MNTLISEPAEKVEMWHFRVAFVMAFVIFLEEKLFLLVIPHSSIAR